MNFTACKEDNDVDPGGDPVDTTDVINEPMEFDINQITDTYGDIANPSMYKQWGPYNVHDPSVIDDGEYFYSYSTDVAYGNPVRPGLQIRRSKDLVEWEYVGWVFNALPAIGSNFIRSNGGEPFEGLWAPYIMKVGSEYRLYYSLSSPTPRLSVIGLATASNPEGPWTEKDLVVTSKDDATIQTNAIDPTVIVDKSGNYWLYYGSAWDGIYMLELDPASGLAASPGDKGVRIAQRGFTGNSINGNIEGPEIIYNEDFDQYYLFIAYDWLETKYNVRVGKSDSPEGPFYDINGQDLNEDMDNIPMLVAPYRFVGHGGWQGTAHCAVFERDGAYFMAHQGRPGVDRFFMVMHVRKIYWTEEGWPMVSPERFAAIPDEAVTDEEIAGIWERIFFDYKVVPGYAEEQFMPGMQLASTIELTADGVIGDNDLDTWSYESPWLTLSWEDGNVDLVYVHRGRDWENSVAETLLFTGMNQNNTTIWGKKTE